MVTHELRLELDTDAPYLAGHLFDFMRTEARAAGFPDVEDLTVTVTVRFGGFDTSLRQVEKLHHRLEQFWAPDVRYEYRKLERDGDYVVVKLVDYKKYPGGADGETVGEVQLKEQLKGMVSDA